MRYLKGLEKQALGMRDLSNIPVPESGEKYHHFLYLLCEKLKPSFVVELGSYKGTSTKYMAFHSERVLSVDNHISTNTEYWLNQHPKFLNITHIQTDALLAEKYITKPIDILFIDNLHTYDHTIAQYRMYKPYMKSGGLIVVDDITLDDEMKRFWSGVKEEKVELNSLHHAGFGVIGC